MSSDPDERLGEIERRLARLESSLAEIQRALAIPPAAEEPAARPEPWSEWAPEAEPVPEPAVPAPALQPEPALRWYEGSHDLSVSDLLGARALAWAGGIVTLLGVVLFFALAVNRGWIGPEARVALAAAASALVLGGGLYLHRRFGETHSALAAVGAGIGGFYATLVAAGPHYGLLPDAAALALAALVAGVALAVALRWSSELVAGLGLVGAMVVQIPISWGDGLTSSGTGFTALMFAAAAAVVVVRRWETLLTVSAIAVVPQVVILAVEHRGEAPPGAIAAALGCAAVLLAAAIGLQLRSESDLDGFPASVAIGAAVLASLSTAILVSSQTWEGVALLGIAAVYGAAAAVFFVRPRNLDLSALLGAVGLAVTAVAVADLLSGPALAIAWAAEAGVLSWLAVRIRDVRYQLASLAYLVLAAGHAVIVDAPPRHLFVEVPHPAQGVAAVIAASLAAAVVAERCRHERRADRFEELRRVQRELRFGCGLLAAVGLLYAASLGLLELPLSFAWDQVAVTGLLVAAPVAALAAGLAHRLRGVELGAAVVLGLAVVKNLAFDVTQLETPQRSWTMLIVAAGLLAAGFAFARFDPWARTLDALWMAAVAASVPFAVIGLFDLLDGDWHRIDRTGAALLVPTLAYAALAAVVFREERLRDLSTLLWSCALVVGAIAAALLVGGTPLTLVWAAVAALLAWLSHRTGEVRLQAGAAAYVVLAVGHALVRDAPPTDFFESSRHPAAGAGAVAAAALAVLALALVLRIPAELQGRVSRTPVLVLAGVLVTYAVSLVVLELFELGGGRIESRFEHGHVAVSALWGVLALVLLYLGLTRRLTLRLAGFALFGVTLAKIFLYDLRTLSPVARAMSFLAVGAVLLLGGFFYQRLGADGSGGEEAAGR